VYSLIVLQTQNVEVTGAYVVQLNW